MRMDAENTHQVFDWLWTSGQLSARDVEQLPALGIEAVVNLALPTSTNALPGEAELITRQGIVYVQIPVLWEKPELSQLDQFFGVLSLYEGRRKCGRSPFSRSRERASKISGKAIANPIAPIHLNFCWRIRPYASVS